MRLKPYHKAPEEKFHPCEAGVSCSAENVDQLLNEACKETVKDGLEHCEHVNLTLPLVRKSDIWLAIAAVHAGSSNVSCICGVCVTKPTLKNSFLAVAVTVTESW